jgi:Transmembrane protein 33/Nucleoporin POM33
MGDFDAFDFDTNEQFQAYWSKLEFVTAPSDRMTDKLRRRWYKRNVDDQFDDTPQKEQVEEEKKESSSSTTRQRRSAPFVEDLDDEYENIGDIKPDQQESEEREERSEETNRSTSNSNSSANSTSNANGTVSNGRRLYWALNVAVFVCSLLSVLPFVGGSQWYRRALLVAFGSYATSFFLIAGRPQFSKQWFADYVMSPGASTCGDVHFAALALIFLVHPGQVAPVIVSIAMLSALQLSNWVLTNRLAESPMRARVPATLMRWIDVGADYVLTGSQQLCFYVASMTLVGFVYCIFQMFAGSGSFITLFLYVQWLRARYRACAYTKHLFSMLAYYSHHQRIPSFLRSPISMVRNFLSRLA